MIPLFPEWAPITLDMREELHPHFLRLTSGISEFTFSNIFLFRHTYGYRLSKLSSGLYAISGSRYGKSFFALPWGLPDRKTLDALFASHDYLKNQSDAQVQEHGSFWEQEGFEVREDRDNWDYLYLAAEMAHLEGKKFHKKRNQIHGFFHEHTYESKTLEKSDLPQALQLLEDWTVARDDRADYIPSKEALEYQFELGLEGKLYFVEGKVAGYALGEPIPGHSTFVIHFEKADHAYRGIYQVIFNDYAKELAQTYELINREQDLGDPGLRQAKETYRQIGFIKKYQVHRKSPDTTFL